MVWSGRAVTQQVGKAGQNAPGSVTHDCLETVTSVEIPIERCISLLRDELREKCRDA
jgi:hypothetical protein